MTERDLRNDTVPRRRRRAAQPWPVPPHLRTRSGGIRYTVERNHEGYAALCPDCDWVGPRERLSNDTAWDVRLHLMLCHDC